MRGRSELQAGAVMVIVGAVGLGLLRVWANGFAAAAPGTAFTGHGFASAVIAIMLVGVLAIGVVLVLLGGLLWLIQRSRNARERHGAQ